jgi:glycosyltransferase involved in cell wall biosynthesis
MRILLAAHYYLPRHQAGTELYTRALARRFCKEGHEVCIFTSEDESGQGFHVAKDSYEGLKVFRIFHSQVPDFKSSYARPEFDQLFGQTLDEVKPDIVHFQHLFRLSTGFVSEAKKRKIPALLTLADYWLICPAIIMLKPEEAICPGPDEGRSCANCPHAFSAFAQDLSPSLAWLWKTFETGLAYAHKFKRQLPPSVVDSMRELFGKKDEHDKKLTLISERWMEMKRAVDDLSLLISPSQFLLEMMVVNRMVPKEKIIFSDYGFESEGFQKAGQAASRKEGILTLGFIGTLVKHKGVETLIQAVRSIPDAKLDLKIFGETRDFPGFVRSLKKLAARDRRIKWMGRMEHDQIADALRGIDVLVVPSLWYENSPLTIHEAFMARVPVIASNIGGMKELIQDGGGMLFETGNSADLAAKIKVLAEDPARIATLKKSIPQVKTIEENCRELMILYQMLIKNASADS